MKALADQRELPRHPIGVVSERTGLSQDVLRVWERRYRVVQPERDTGGQRMYTDADIDRLALLSAAVRAGRSVGQVAKLSTDALAALVDEDVNARARRVESMAEPTAEASETVSSALELARSLNSAALNETLRRAATVMGMPAFLESVATPLLRRVGEEWHAGRMTPAQEHLASAVLYDLITDTMRSFAHRGPANLLVATLAGERHAIGAALAGAAAAVDGWRVVYLGADLPATEIADAAAATGVGIVAISVIYLEDRERIVAELRTLRARLPSSVRLIVGGGGAASLAADLSLMDARLESSVAGLLAELRRDRLER